MRLPVFLFFLLVHAGTRAATFEMPPPEFDLVGTEYQVEARQEDTLLDIARRHGIGQEEILGANPGVDRWLPGAGTRVMFEAPVQSPRS